MPRARRSLEVRRWSAASRMRTERASERLGRQVQWGPGRGGAQPLASTAWQHACVHARPRAHMRDGAGPSERARQVAHTGSRGLVAVCRCGRRWRLIGRPRPVHGPVGSARGRTCPTRVLPAPPPTDRGAPARKNIPARTCTPCTRARGARFERACMHARQRQQGATWRLLNDMC